MMYIIETKKNEWYAFTAKKEAEKMIGKAGSKESLEKCNNLWFQAYTGLEAYFFQVIKDGQKVDMICMENMTTELPLSKCKEGGVTFVGKKEPKWYTDFLA